MAKMPRDEYYMRIAHVTSMRATCDRRHVGAVVVAADRILSGGFNGAPSGLPECDEVGHMMVDGHCVRTIHAEANAVLEVGANRIRHLVHQGQDVTLYATTFPCQWCMKIVVQAGITRIVYGEEYTDESHPGDEMAYGREVAKLLGITIESFPMDTLK